MTKDGVYRLKRERDGSIDMKEDDEGYENDDAWLNSIRGQQAEMAKEAPQEEHHDESDSGEKSESDEDIKPKMNTQIEIKLLQLLLHLMKNQADKFKRLDEEDFKS